MRIWKLTQKNSILKKAYFIKDGVAFKPINIAL